MDIYSRPGRKVVFKHPTSGYDHDKETAAKHLKEGQVYTVDRTVVGGWHTAVYLDEVPGVGFNSVQFEDFVGTEPEPKGYTLIELLITIVIVTVGFAVLVVMASVVKLGLIFLFN